MSRAKTSTPADLSQITVCDDPLPNHRALPCGKYDAILAKLKVGQGIKCPPADVGKVSSAMRKWIATNKINATVRSMSNYGDGMGRVWMLHKQQH